MTLVRMNTLSRDRETRCIILKIGPLPTFGITLWRRGAISFLYNGSVPFQIVFGDWWKAHPEAKR